MKKLERLSIRWVLAATILTFGCKKNSNMETSAPLSSRLNPKLEIALTIPQACDQIASTQYLISVRNVAYNALGTMVLTNPVNHNVDVCNDHFDASTSAGHQYNSAVDEVNRVEGSTLHYTTTRSGITHRNAMNLFPAFPSSSFFDYVNVAGPLPNYCNLSTDLNFALRTCRYDNTGGLTNHFNILVNSSVYDHFSNPSSSNYPQKSGILHELAHSFGMIHTPTWNTNDRKYISTMQGNLEYLSPLDISYLRHFYPEALVNHRNYVASSLTRFDGIKGIFSRINTNTFYITSSGELKDCSTHADPWFYAAWFNTGNLDGESNICLVNKFYFRKKLNHNEKIELRTWKAATMPYLSQDQWKGQVSKIIANPSTIDYNSDWELVFETNASHSANESNFNDNIVTMDIKLYYESCKFTNLPRPSDELPD